MKIVLEIEAPIEEAQAVKELLAMKLEGIGRVNVLDITDDGNGVQQTFYKR